VGQKTKILGLLFSEDRWWSAAELLRTFGRSELFLNLSVLVKRGHLETKGDAPDMKFRLTEAGKQKLDEVLNLPSHQFVSS